MRIAEIFGHAVEDLSTEAHEARRQRLCPFRGNKCTKSSKADPIGVCSLTNEEHATLTCPVRFIEGNKIFVDAARIAFGEQTRFAIVPEVRILRIENEGGRKRKIGKVDYLLAKLENGDEVKDFAALEVQATYFSGRSIRPPMRHFIEHGTLPVGSERRPDYRSSAQKRLIPQLSLKVPVFRRWGKKFFVVVDTLFLDALPHFESTSPANSEVTWLAIHSLYNVFHSEHTQLNNESHWANLLSTTI